MNKNINPHLSILIACLMLVSISISCSHKDKEPTYRTSIKRSGEQDSLFRNIAAITNGGVSETVLSDSLAVFILPIEAACPSCRNKAIDSIIRHKADLPENRLIIISGTGMRNIESFFIEQNHKLPISRKGIFIDSINAAFISDLVYTTPSIYFSYNRKVYEKVSCVPDNIKDELHKFFSMD